MQLPMNPIILIPARMASTRLPNKPMAMIQGLPMIVHCYRRALEAKLARIVIACDDVVIQRAIEAEGGEAILTEADLPSGSDRIYAALSRIDAEEKHDVVINVQGDMPTLAPQLIAAALRPLKENPSYDIATLGVPIHAEEDIHNPAVVKIARAESGQALYFSRQAIPANEGEYLHHLGIYAYRRDALERFIKLAPSPLEKREKLEQLRALEHGMKIGVEIVSTSPLGVDTPEQLEEARRLLSSKK